MKKFLIILTGLLLLIGTLPAHTFAGGDGVYHIESLTSDPPTPPPDWVDGPPTLIVGRTYELDLMVVYDKSSNNSEFYVSGELGAEIYLGSSIIMDARTTAVNVVNENSLGTDADYAEYFFNSTFLITEDMRDIEAAHIFLSAYENPLVGDELDFHEFSYGVDIIAEPVPEPATLLLLGSGLVGLAVFRRKKTA